MNRARNWPFQGIEDRRRGTRVPPGRRTGTEPAQLYLDLMKRCLLDLIYVDDPFAVMVPAGVAHRRRPLRAALRVANRALAGPG